MIFPSDQKQKRSGDLIHYWNPFFYSNSYAPHIRN